MVMAAFAGALRAATCMEKKMKHVIIGSGPAGVTAAETIRKHAPQDEIVLIGEEAGFPYARMNLPRLLSGQIKPDDLRLGGDAHYFSRLNVSRVHSKVLGLNARKRLLTLADGNELRFDTLLIASGARPKVPLITGIDLPRVRACWTMEDARAIAAMTPAGSKVAVIGAGFVGCILMEAMQERGVTVAMIERRERILPNFLNRGAANVVRAWCERRGVQFFTSTHVIGIGVDALRNDARYLVRLSNGMQYEIDAVIYAAGTRPNIEFLKGSGVRTLEGVVVDASMQTNVDGIYAAGDCAESFDVELGKSVIAGTQPNAADQAYCAALNMCGKQAVQRGVRQIDVIDTMGLVSSSFGCWQGVRDGDWVEMGGGPDCRYMSLEFRGDVLIGSTTVGVNEYASVLRALIQHQVPLGPWKERLLQDPTLVSQAYHDCVQERIVQRASRFGAGEASGLGGAHFVV